MRDCDNSRKIYVLSFLTVCAVIFLDRIAKIYFNHLLSYGESIAVWPNVFHFTLVHNTGIAFGLFKNQGFVFIVIPVAAIAFILYHIIQHKKEETVNLLYVFAFSLILGGAIGNLTDRLVYGYVIDFLDFRIWPVFNIADSAITIGTFIILIKCIPFFAK